MKKLVLLLTAFAIAGSVSLTGCSTADTDTEEVTPEVENTTPVDEAGAETKEEVKIDEKPAAVEETETPAEGN